MHEWSLAEAVLQSVQDQLKDKGKVTVKSVTLLLGELQNIDPEIFMAGLKELSRHYPFDARIFHMEREKASFHCNRCSREWDLEEHRKLNEDTSEAIHFLPESAHAYLRCLHCGSPDFRVVKGRGVVIQSIEYVEGETV